MDRPLVTQDCNYVGDTAEPSHLTVLHGSLVLVRFSVFTSLASCSLSCLFIDLYIQFKTQNDN